jgi:bifunctional non-homologous end joining protein LigD
MKGEWLLVRMKPRGKEKRENWLRKVEDVHAGASEQLVERELTSVLTGRSMAEIEGDRQGSQSWQARRAKPSTPPWSRRPAKCHGRKKPARRATRSARLPV